jgi:hypothetical protein
MKENPQKSIAHKAGQDKLSPFASLGRLHLLSQMDWIFIHIFIWKKYVDFDLHQGKILKQGLF